MNLNWVMVILLVIGCALLVTPTTATTGWLESHDNRISLEIDHSDLGAGLDQFPVALFITDSSGIGGTDLTLIFDEVGDDYTKVAVTSGNGVTVLYTEVECWDAVNEQAVLWVSPDLSASENTTLYLYFDATAPNNPRIGWTGTAATHLSNTDALVTWDGTVGSVETVDAVPLPVWIAVLIGAVGCVLHCWADCDNEKHLQIVTGAFGMLMLLWLGVTLSGGTIAYYLDDGLHTIQDSILPWFFGMFAVVIGIMVSGYVAELFVVEIESEEGVDS